MVPAPEFCAMKGYREAGAEQYMEVGLSYCGRLTTEEISPVTCKAFCAEPRAILEAMIRRQPYKQNCYSPESSR
jgi:hypothetical protein